MLNDVQHVAAYAIIKRLVEQAPYPDGEVLDAGGVWLEENKPSSEAYSAAAHSMVESGKLSPEVGGVAGDLRDEAGSG